MTLPIKDFLIQTKPVEVALTLPCTYTEGDILPLHLVEQMLGKMILNIPEDSDWHSCVKMLRSQTQFHARKLLAQEKAIEFAKQNNWMSEQVLVSSKGKFIILRTIEQDYESYDEAQELAKEFDLPTEFGEPQAMWDELCHKRVSSKFILGLLGDDRGQGNGAYYLCLGYCDEEVNKAWFPECSSCGAF